MGSAPQRSSIYYFIHSFTAIRKYAAKVAANVHLYVEYKATIHEKRHSSPFHWRFQCLLAQISETTEYYSFSK